MQLTGDNETEWKIDWIVVKSDTEYIRFTGTTIHVRKGANANEVEFSPDKEQGWFFSVGNFPLTIVPTGENSCFRHVNLFYF